MEDFKEAKVEQKAQHGKAEMNQGFYVPPITWYKDPGLRKLYFMMPILFLGATTNGYDGSLLNGLQTMEPWQKCELQSHRSGTREVLTPKCRLQQPKWRDFGIVQCYLAGRSLFGHLVL